LSIGISPSAVTIQWMLGSVLGVGAVQLRARPHIRPWLRGAGIRPHFRERGARFKHIALTYDDGPNDPHTLRLMEVLARPRCARHIFSDWPLRAQRPDIVRDLVKAGHVVGNHTFTHPHLMCRRRSKRGSAGSVPESGRGSDWRRATPVPAPFGGRRPRRSALYGSLAMEP